MPQDVRDIAPAASVPLVGMPARARLAITWVHPEVRSELAREGLTPGTEITIQGRVPLGGPIIVVSGRTRIAVSPDVAHRVSVRVLADEPAPAEPPVLAGSLPGASHAR